MNPTPLVNLPANASTFTRLRIGYYALQVLKDEPTHAHYGPLLNACLDGTTYAKLARSWRESAAGRRLLDERPSLQGCELDLEALGRLPEGTLGREFVRYFRDNGIEPFVTAFPIENDVDYLSKRYRETHDLLHVVTGYGTDEVGEMELQAFVLGNLGLRQTLLILGTTLTANARELGLAGTRRYINTLRAAYRRGARSRELLSVEYEKLWEEPVTALRGLLCAPA